METLVEVYGNNFDVSNVTDAVVIDPTQINIGYLKNLIRPRKEGKKPLTFIQRLRAVKFFEALIEARILKDNTDQTNLAIAHGSMVGTFLLMRLKESVDASFCYHGFDSSEWKYLENHQSTTSKMTIHVFADTIDEEICGSYLELRSFVPDEHFEIPHYVREAVDLEKPLTMTERVSAMRAYITGIIASTFSDLNIDRIIINNANSLPQVNFLRGFDRGSVRYFNMNEGHFSHKFTSNTSQMGVKVL